MSTLIRDGTVVTGDGSGVITSGAVVIRDGRIVEVAERWSPETDFEGETIDASGCLVMPGLINCHTHGVTPGALFPSAAAALPEEKWMGNLDRHLLAGTTTVLNLCGFASMEDVRVADRRHAVHVRGATTHLPECLVAASMADGGGLTPQVRGLTVERMLEDGAIAIGELGGGQTLGGGGQDLVYIPAAIEKLTGVRISISQSRRIKEAVLGRFIDVEAFDQAELTAAAQDAGLSGRITIEALKTLVAECVLPSFVPAINGIREGVIESARFGVPAIVHSASATSKVLRELMTETHGNGMQVIAAHANHPSHTPSEARELAALGRDYGWAAEASVFDLLHRKHTVTTREHWDLLLSSPNLVSVLGTDYGRDGEHDELISAVQDVMSRGHRTLAGAIAMATSAVAALIPGIAPNSGTLEAGRMGDVVVTNSEDFRDVRFVFVDGVCVVRDGHLTSEAHR
ncbi:amidohydrolase family protein [Arthrobacter sp. CDRTa11]|uniref:amidohydrolase family protein n=1 Tax=Arthrobacter sp. CDRTa11 TaxID=2651199 RepID=UPI002265A8CA|nr:amidohydrolase family protein [Arthrobacter sp. CDRTa11]UZX03181.1 amidohydrolase family protein [Arthrobacter sp. CDRTa11]